MTGPEEAARQEIDTQLAQAGWVVQDKSAVNLYETTPGGRWRAFNYEELVARGKASLDIFWLKDESLEDSANLPDPDVIAGEIVEELRAALEQFEELQAGLSHREATA